MQALRHYLLAVQFFTRIPITGRLADWVGYSPAMLRASAAHFPGIGWLAALLSATVFAALHWALAPNPFAPAVAAVFCTIATVLMWVPYMGARILTRGPARALSDPADPSAPPDPAWAQRARRAHANAVENLAVFAPLVLILALTWGALQLQVALAGFLNGESIWSKAQKQSVIALESYAISGDPADLSNYRENYGVLMADRSARDQILSGSYDYEEVAGALRRSNTVTIAIPGVISIALITFLFGWAQFLFPLVLSTDLSTQPLTVLIAALQGRHIVPSTLMSAAGILAIAVPAVIALAFNRYIVNGLLAGSTK